MKIFRFLAALLAIACIASGQNAWSQVTSGSLQTHTFQGGLGWQMVSAPGDSSEDFSTQGIFAYAWQPAINNYAAAPTPPADTFHPGQGYWAYLNQSVTVAVDTTGVGSSGTVNIPLKAGWNQVGDPFPQPLPLSSLTLQDSFGYSTRFSTAVSNYTVSPLYPYDPVAGSYVVLANDTDVLQPWAGAWLYVFNPMTLSVPRPSSGTGTTGTPPGGSNLYAGHWVGPWTDAGLGQQGTYDITIDSNGQVSGTVTNDNAPGAAGIVGGTVSNAGTINWTYNYQNGYGAGYYSAAGSLSIDAAGRLSGAYSAYSGSSLIGTETFSLSRAGSTGGGGTTQANPYAGHWIGPWTDAGLGQQGIYDITIDSNGQVSGTVTNDDAPGAAGTVSGTVSDTGTINWTYDYQNGYGAGYYSATGSLSIDATGKLSGSYRAYSGSSLIGTETFSLSSAGSTGGGGTTQTNPYAGHWIGPWTDPGLGQQGTFDITIDANGQTAGTVSNTLATGVGNVSGTVSNAGDISWTYDYQDGSVAGFYSASGSLSIDGTGKLAGSIDEFRGGSKFGTASFALSSAGTGNR